MKYVTNRENAVEQFAWPVDRGGYECVETELVSNGVVRYPFGPQPAICSAPPHEPLRSAPKWYIPDGEAIDMELAGTHPTPDGVRSFARKYGLLGAGPTQGWKRRADRVPFLRPFDGYPLGREAPPPLGVLCWDSDFAEPLAHWKYHITLLQTMMKIRSLIDGGRGQAMNELLGQSPRLSEDALQAIARSYHSGFLLPPQGTVSLPNGCAWVIVDGPANRAWLGVAPYHLAHDPTFIAPEFLDSDAAAIEWARRWLEIKISWAFQTYIPTGFRYGARRGYASRGVRFSPIALVGLAYAQYAEDLSGQRGPTKRCPHCRTYFVVTDRRMVYCGNDCKQAAYRLRRGMSAAP